MTGTENRYFEALSEIIQESRRGRATCRWCSAEQNVLHEKWCPSFIAVRALNPPTLAEELVEWWLEIVVKGNLGLTRFPGVEKLSSLVERAKNETRDWMEDNS